MSRGRKTRRCFFFRCWRKKLHHLLLDFLLLGGGAVCVCVVGATFLEDSYRDLNTPVGSRGLKGALKGTIPQSATRFDSSEY